MNNNNQLSDHQILEKLIKYTSDAPGSHIKFNKWEELYNMIVYNKRKIQS